MKSIRFAWMILLALALLAGCSSKGGTEDEGADAGADSTAGGKASGSRIGKYGRPGDRGTYGSGGNRAGSGDLDDPAGPLAKRVIYFLYDSYEVLPEYQPVVDAHANYLAAHPEQNAVLEGHADERGSPEYNVALAEQRAKAVQRLMQLQGVGAGQMRLLSYGEEKPATSGHDENAWQQNRRVEISYPGH